MARRAALAYLALASPAVLVSFCLSGTAAEIAFTALAMGYPVALVVLAVSRNGRLGPLAAPLLGLGVLLEASAVTMLVLRGRVLDGPWIGGLPLALVVLLCGLWLAPFPLVVLAYALGFDRLELREEDLRQVEDVRRKGEGAT